LVKIYLQDAYSVDIILNIQPARTKSCLQVFSFMRKGSIILIDGSNFYFKLKDLGLQNQLEFDFRSFSTFLSSDYNNISTTYYIGAVKTDGSSKTARLHSNQQKLLVHLRKNNVSYVLGYLLKSQGKFHEKGVDVRMAVDILSFCS